MKKNQMTGLKDLLPEAAKKLRLRRGVRQQRVRDAWAAAVGDLLARHSEPVKVQGDTLFVRTVAAAWAQEISLRQAEILARLNLPNEDPPTSIRCWIGPVEGSLLPQVAPKVEKFDWERVTLNAQTLARLEAIAAELEDESLRKTLLKTMIMSEKKNELRRRRGYLACPLCEQFRPPHKALCHDCEREQEQGKERTVLQTLAREPWLTLRDLQGRFPHLSRADYLKLHTILRSNLWRQCWQAFHLVEDGEALPDALRSNILELTMLTTSLAPHQLSPRHFYHSLGRQLAMSYLEDRKYTKAEAKKDEETTKD